MLNEFGTWSKLPTKVRNQKNELFHEYKKGTLVTDQIWRQTQQLMEESEQLVKLITCVCYNKLSSVCYSAVGVLNRCCYFGHEGDSTNSSVACSSYPRRWGGKWRYRKRRGSCDGFLRAPEPIRSPAPLHRTSLLTLIFLLVVSFARFADGCSSKSTPKPRPSSPSSGILQRPNITFQTYACPPAYAAWYCLNGATCFTVEIKGTILYNCECADGYMGQRCEFKDLDGSYLDGRAKILMETASIASGAAFACILVFIVLFSVYVFLRKDKKYRDIEDGGQNRPPDYMCTVSTVYTLIVPAHQQTYQDTNTVTVSNLPLTEDKERIGK